MNLPENTVAVVVGLEEYEIGPEWCLDGPVNDALQFARWLIQNGVRSTNITALLAPLPSSRALISEFEYSIDIKRATRTGIVTELTSGLARVSSDLLIVYLGGHGFVHVDDRRLLYAEVDTGTRTNLNITDLLKAMRTDSYRGHRRQILFADICLTYTHTASRPDSIPNETLPKGRGDNSVRQFSFFAASPGQQAVNKNSIRSGLYSSTLRRLLADIGADGLHDPHMLAGRLREEFTALKERGEAEQTPSSFEYVGPADEITYVGPAILPKSIDSPYWGLRPFGKGDAAFFYGRGAAVGGVLRLLSDRYRRTSVQDGTPALAVITGLSGAGKSSLVRAGVANEVGMFGLDSAPAGPYRWECKIVDPGDRPLDSLVGGVAGLSSSIAREELALTLRNDPSLFRSTVVDALNRSKGAGRPQTVGRLLIVVDQCEQLFTRCEDDGARMSFIGALQAAASGEAGIASEAPALVLLVVRNDFEALLAEYRADCRSTYSESKTAAREQDQDLDRYLLKSMTEDELWLAITGPAQVVGSEVEASLVALLIQHMRQYRTKSPEAETRSGAGALPLLSYALDQAWRSRNRVAGDPLTLADYNRTGGIAGAIGTAASQIYEELTTGQKVAAHRIFMMHLVKDEGGDLYADQAIRRDLIKGLDAARVADVDAVLGAFAAKRLLTLSEGGTVNLSHEALLTSWERLNKDWRNEGRLVRSAYKDLLRLARDWSVTADSTTLPVGEKLQSAQETRARVVAGEVRGAAIDPEVERFLDAAHRAERRGLWVRRGVQAGLLTLVALLVLTLGLVFTEKQEKSRQRDIAVANTLIGQSRELATSDPDGARLSSLAAWRVEQSDNARFAMLDAAAGRQIAALPTTSEQNALISVAHDGETLATIGMNTSVELWNTRTHTRIGSPLDGRYLAASFSPNGKTLATSGLGVVHFWEVATGKDQGSLPVSADPGVTVEFVDDTTIATVDNTGIVRSWNIAIQKPIGDESIDDPRQIKSARFINDGRIVLSLTEASNRRRLWDRHARRELFSPDSVSTGPFAINSASTMMAIADADRIHLRNPVDGNVLADPLSGQTNINRIGFSSDGNFLATSDPTGTLMLWNLSRHPAASYKLAGDAGQISSIKFFDNGKVLATGGSDGTVRLWDTTRLPQISAATMSNTSSSRLASPTGLLVVNTGDPGVELNNVTEGRTETASMPFESALFLAASPDRKTFASTSADGLLAIQDATTGRLIQTADLGRDGGIVSAKFNSDGSVLAVAGHDGLVWLLRVPSLEQLSRPLPGHNTGARTMAFSIDGLRLATSDWDGNLRLWDTHSGEQIGQTVRASNWSMTDMEFIDDGRALLAIAHDEVASILSVPDLRRDDISLTSSVGAMALTADHRTAALVGLDGSIRLWDLTTRRRIGEPLPGVVENMISIAFSSDSRMLAASGPDGQVRIWNTEILDNVIDYICARSGTSMTDEKWDKLAPLGPRRELLCPAVQPSGR